MSIYEASITNPKKQLEFYKDLSEQLQQENKILRENAENNDKVVDKVNWENMLLKKQYLNAVADYETTMAERNELKKQLEDYKYSHSCSFVDTCKNVKIANFNQQKEFINFLEDNYKETQDIWYIKVLQKYKEIIGDDK